MPSRRCAKIPGSAKKAYPLIYDGQCQSGIPDVSWSDSGMAINECNVFHNITFTTNDVSEGSSSNIMREYGSNSYNNPANYLREGGAEQVEGGVGLFGGPPPFASRVLFNKTT